MSSTEALSTLCAPSIVSDDITGVNSYPLSRNFVDFNRLDLQHHLWKDIFGYTLHPGILRNSEFLKVADIATGTGLWLLDLHTQLKLNTKTELVGLDVDIEQAGPKEWFPSNFSLRKLSIFDEVPADFIGSFDIVNVRLIVFVIESDPTSVLRNILKLLSE